MKQAKTKLANWQLASIKAPRSMGWGSGWNGVAKSARLRPKVTKLTRPNGVSQETIQDMRAAIARMKSEGRWVEDGGVV